MPTYAQGSDLALAHREVSKCADLEFILNNLYVAVTRCKSRLTFVEVRSETGGVHDARVGAVNAVANWMRQLDAADVLKTADTLQMLGVDHTPAQHIAAGCRLMARVMEGGDSDEESILREWTENAIHHFDTEAGDEPTFLQKAKLQFDMVLHHRRKIDELSKCIDFSRPCEWEEKAAQLVRRGWSEGLMATAQILVNDSRFTIQIAHEVKKNNNDMIR